MKKLIILLILFMAYQTIKAQSIIPVKDTILQRTVLDSLYYPNFVKIIPFKDSGVVVIAYQDSLPDNPQKYWSIAVTAFDKDLNALWTRKFPISLAQFSTISGDIDSRSYLKNST